MVAVIVNDEYCEEVFGYTHVLLVCPIPLRDEPLRSEAVPHLLSTG